MATSRNTKQKEILNKSLKNFNSFFTAGELLNKVLREDSKIGIATVYRFLNELTKKGEICSYICNRKTIYSVGKRSHCHFVCEKCDKIKHIDINSLDFVKNKIDGRICHFQIDITGVCEKCI